MMGFFDGTYGHGKSFRERDPYKLGIVVTILIAFVMVLTFRFQYLPFVSSARNVSADFAEVGGLRSGDEVLVSGAVVGEVKKATLHDGRVRVDFTISGDKIDLGSTTRASIVTITLLGKAGLELDPSGAGKLSGNHIPFGRTSSPYDVTSALSELTTQTSQIDVASLATALNTLSGTFDSTPKELKSALTGITRISQTIGDHDQSLQQLLDRSKEVTGVLSERNAKVTTLLGTGNVLLTELNRRQQVIVSLLSETSTLSTQLSGFVKENNQDLNQALGKLNQVTAMLNRNKNNIQEAIDGLNNYATELGEAIASGPFFDAYVQNLTSPSTLAPVLSGILK